MTPVVELTRLAKSYRVGPLAVPVLIDISLVLRPGEFVAISGESGSGKSTLLNVLGLLDRADAGSYLLDGRDVSGMSDDERTLLRNRKIGFIFQQSPMFPRLSVEENIAVPLQYRGATTAAAREEVKLLLQRMSLNALGERLPTQLSGGQLQRVAIARALIGKPKLILADEPTASLDGHTSEEVMSLLRAFSHETGAAMLLITHLPEEAAFADRHFQLAKGGLQPLREPALVASAR